MPKDRFETYRILAVDDEESVLNLYKDVLVNQKETSRDLSEFSDLESQLFGKGKPPSSKSAYSFDLTTCHQGDEAIAAVEKGMEEDRPFSLAILDVRMPPGPDGVQTAERIRTLDPMIEILIVTGYSDVDPKEIAIRVVPAHKLLYIQKPFHPQEIYQFVCALCAKWKNECIIKNYNERLLTQIREQTHELKKANEELREEIRVREESETALRESEKKFRDLFEKSSDHLYIHDLEGNLISSNLAFKKGCGYDETDLYQRNMKDFIPERYRAKFDEYLKRIIEKGHDEDVVILMTRDGREIIVEYNNSLIRDSKGNPVAIRGSGRDATERVKVEEEKQTLELQLLRMQRMEAVGTLAAGIAHNFNNLLMGILGNASLASLEIEESHQVQRNLENIKTLVDSGSRLTKQILDYSKGGSHQMEPVKLDLVIGKMLNTVDKTRSDIHIHHDIDQDLYAVDGDRGQIEQALLNLYVNAVEAMPDGGDLFLEAKNLSHLKLADKPFKGKADNYVRIIVKDTGVGIDEKTKEHIFEPFFTTKGLVKGTGLGLASAYGIIKAHGGTIEVESKKGAGASFIIYLPAISKKAVHSFQEEHDIVYGNETILVVDDEEIILETSEHLLRYLGYTVIKARSGREAIDLYQAKREEIDLIILDLIMPDIGGADAFNRLIAIDKDLKVILSSGYSMDDHVQEVINRGCKGFIQKPFDIKELSFIIRKVLM